MAERVVLAVQLYLVVVALDVLVAWVQPDPTRWPRRLLHLLTEPPQRLLRPVSSVGGWDLSPLVLILLLGALRVALDRA